MTERAWGRRGRRIGDRVVASVACLLVAVLVIGVIQLGRQPGGVTILDHYDVIVDNRDNPFDVEIQAEDVARVYHAFTIRAQSRVSLPDGDWSTLYEVDATCAIVSAAGLRWGPDPVVTFETQGLPIDVRLATLGPPPLYAATASPPPSSTRGPASTPGPILSALPSTSCPNGPRSTVPTMPPWSGS